MQLNYRACDTFRNLIDNVSDAIIDYEEIPIPVIKLSNSFDNEGYTRVTVTDNQNTDILYKLLKSKLKKWIPRNKINTFMYYLNDNVVITGSFILNLIYNFNKNKKYSISNLHTYNNKTNSKYSDLDIFVNQNEDISHLIKFLESLGFRNSNNFQINNAYNNAAALSRYIVEIKQFFINGYTKIDIVIVNDKPNLCIKNTFDLKLVMNYFNGGDIYLLHPDTVIKKSENITFIPTCIKHYERMYKYMLRGFSITIFDMSITKYLCDMEYSQNHFSFDFSYDYPIFAVDTMRFIIATLIVEKRINDNYQRRLFVKNLIKYASYETENYLHPGSKYIQYYFMNRKESKFKIIKITSDNNIKILKIN